MIIHSSLYPQFIQCAGVGKGQNTFNKLSEIIKEAFVLLMFKQIKCNSLIDLDILLVNLQTSLKMLAYNIFI